MIDNANNAIDMLHKRKQPLKISKKNNLSSIEKNQLGLNS